MGQYDQEVVNNGGNITGFGQQSLRMSNLCANSEFFYQTYSTPVGSPAGEDKANSTYVGQFSFFDGAFQEGLFISVSPDSYEGSRMQWVGLEDTPDGVETTFTDSPNVDGEFQDYPGPTLAHGVPHTIRWVIRVNPGPDNDLVRISVDGQDLGQCFTTWENYYRTASEQEPPPNVNNPAPISSMQFRSSVPGFAGPAGGGYLFDNVLTATSNPPPPVGCDLEIDKKADASTVTAGGLEGYTLSVRNRGRAIARNYLLCDRIPRRMKFVRANRKLHQVRRQRCLVIRQLKPGARDSVHISLRVDSNAPPGNLDNIADIIPIPPPGVLPPGVLLPSGPSALPPAADIIGKRIPVRAIKKVKAIVKILKRAATTRPSPPPFTG